MNLSKSSTEAVGARAKLTLSRFNGLLPLALKNKSLTTVTPVGIVRLKDPLNQVSIVVFKVNPLDASVKSKFGLPAAKSSFARTVISLFAAAESTHL